VRPRQQQTRPETNGGCPGTFNRCNAQACACAANSAGPASTFNVGTLGLICRSVSTAGCDLIRIRLRTDDIQGAVDDQRFRRGAASRTQCLQQGSRLDRSRKKPQVEESRIDCNAV